MDQQTSRHFTLIEEVAERRGTGASLHVNEAPVEVEQIAYLDLTVRSTVEDDLPIKKQKVRCCSSCCFVVVGLGGVQSKIKYWQRRGNNERPDLVVDRLHEVARDSVPLPVVEQERVRAAVDLAVEAAIHRPGAGMVGCTGSIPEDPPIFEHLHVD